MKSIIKQFKEGLLTNNPVFIQFLGMCSTMAISIKIQNGLGMGLAATAVLICSNVVISLLRKVIPAKVRIASYIVIVAGFVTAIDLLMQAYLPDLSEALGVFIPLIVVNCIILARAEAFASKNKVLPSAIDGLAMGLGFTLALLVMCAIREVLGAGTLAGVQVMPDGYQPAMLLILPAGGFLTLGFLVAIFQYFLKKGE